MQSLYCQLNSTKAAHTLILSSAHLILKHPANSKPDFKALVRRANARESLVLTITTCRVTLSG